MAVSALHASWVTPEVLAWCESEPKAGDVLETGDAAYICTLVETVPAGIDWPRHKVWHVSPVDWEGRYLDHRGQLQITG